MQASTAAIAALGFDLDGTLVDSAGEIAEAANRALVSQGLARRTEAAVTIHIGAGSRELMLRLSRDAAVGHALDEGAFDDNAVGERAVDADVDVDAEALVRDFGREYEQLLGTTCRPYPACLAALERLRAGGIRLACITNKDERFARRMLASCGLADFFELVVGGDTLPVRKPDGAVIGHVLRAMGLEAARMAHVGDSRTDVETARNGGVAAWAVPYGYNAGEDIALSRPDRLFDDLGEVADHLVGRR